MSTLYAIPTPLGGEPQDVLSPSTIQTIRGLRHFVVENAKSARAFLGALGMPVRELIIEEIGNDHLRGDDIGLLSEAGCPAIADPGAAMALMASGLEGQRFAFCGYLPREAVDRKKRIKELENRSKREDETEIFIETPYRNDALLGALLESCQPQARLCVAIDLTLPSESVTTKTVAEWRRTKAAIGRRPAVFLLYLDPPRRA